MPTDKLYSIAAIRHVAQAINRAWNNMMTEEESMKCARAALKAINSYKDSRDG